MDGVASMAMERRNYINNEPREINRIVNVDFRRSSEDDVLGEFVELVGLVELGDELGVDGLALADVVSGVAVDVDQSVLGEDLGQLGDQRDGLPNTLNLYRPVLLDNDLREEQRLRQPGIPSHSIDIGVRLGTLSLHLLK